MRLRTAARAATLALAALAACAAPPASDEHLSGHRAITTDSLEPYACGTIQRLHTQGGVFLASQPAPADFEQAEEGGVRTVVNLRKDAEQPDFDERAFVEGLGVAYVHLPWSGPDELTETVFDEARAILSTAERPMLVHCSSGNRVGAVWIPYRVLDQGVPLEDALAEARTIGLRSPAFEAKAIEYVERHR